MLYIMRMLAPLSSTRERLAGSPDRVGWLPVLAARQSTEVQFRDWTQGRVVRSLGTNAGAVRLPFQTWHHFKEAFAPELVERAVRESPIAVHHLLDPFGGSGTSGLSAQFLGVASTSIEVNPFLADVIRAKTARYDSAALVRDLGRVMKRARHRSGTTGRFAACPPTFVEPGNKERYLFGAEVAERLAVLLDAFEAVEIEPHRRLFRVLLGGILSSVSNALISGKGRRYRRDWQSRPVDPKSVETLFVESASRAINEIHAHGYRPRVAAQVVNEDSRLAINHCAPAELVIFSPPYPNSFDYTDVYNLELWMLGYLGDGADNRLLRRSTLSSHVQIKREFASAPKGSRRLTRALKLLDKHRDSLWSPWIPEMVGGYFADMGKVLSGCADRLVPSGQIWMVVGDSQYAEISIAVDRILMDLAPQWGLRPVSREPFRSMRASAQQGGRPSLAETLVILAKQ